MLKSEKTVINGLQVTTQKHPYFRGMELKAKWAQFIGPALSPIMTSLAKAGITDLAKADINVVVMALGELFLRMDPAEVRPLICETLTFTSVVTTDEKGGQVLLDLSVPNNIETVFANRESDSLKVLWFALKVNLTGLFPAGAMESLAQALAPSPSTSTNP